MFSFILRVRTAPKFVKLGYLCLILALGWSIFWPSTSEAGRTRPSARPPQQVSNQAWTSSTATDEIFIVYRNERGQFACREATKAERDRINKRSGGGPTRLIYSGARRSKGDVSAERSGDDLTSNLALQPSAGLRIVLHGTAQLDQNQTAKMHSYSPRTTGKPSLLRRLPSCSTSTLV